MEKFDIVIIGGGVAGLTVAEEIRKENLNLSVCILSSEKILPYYRLKLPHYIHNPVDQKFFLKPPEWFEKNNVKIRLSSHVTGIDFENKIVFCGNNAIRYEKLIIASGAKPYIDDNTVKGKVKDKVFSLRTYEDLLRLKEVITQVSDITIIGAGLLGLELASTLNGKNLFLIEVSNRLLPKQLDEVGSMLLEEEIRKKKINIVFGSKIEAIERIGNKLLISLSDGKEILSEIVIFTAGVIPNTDFIDNEQILSLKRGISVNTKMQTSITDVFACGDVAYLNNQNPGTWIFAIESSKIAAKNILGKNVEYQIKPIPYFLRAFGVEIVSAGNINDIKSSNIFEYLDREKMVYKKFVIKNKKLIGYLLINDTKIHNELNKLLENEIEQKQIEKYLSIK